MYEQRTQAAIDGVSSRKYPNLKAASKAENCLAFGRVAYTTLRDRAQGKHQSSQAYHTARSLLTPGKEDVVINLAKLSGESGGPWGKAELCAAISNITPVAGVLIHYNTLMTLIY
ncbi:hypothetical protein BDN71DRAFT_1492413 [Pleurotus eryngii]|uniref:Uncharacterized protein n=1 Tax=Pleurotus eryngii TaxID=5323 RepID=A0A9P6ABP8_PLEER|nr:hypothetical protein BDN71DRAFT_1492413 [Pleurotus eryngii]